MGDVDEALVEAAALEWFAGLGYAVAHALTPMPRRPRPNGAATPMRCSSDRLRAAIARINPALPAEAREEAMRVGEAERVVKGTGEGSGRFFDMAPRGPLP
jgi:type I restriction enzyme R subunit